MPRVTLLLALLLACRSPQEAPRPCGDCPSGPTPPPGYPTIVLKTYKVPPGQEKLVERLLDGTTSYPVSVVSAQGNQTQFVNPRPHFTGPASSRYSVRAASSRAARCSPIPSRRCSTWCAHSRRRDVTAASDILRFMTAGRPDAAPEAETSDAREASDAAVAADRRRVEQLYVRLEVKLTSIVYRWLWNREEARDVLQEAFVRLWRMRARIDWDRSNHCRSRLAG